MNDSRPAFRPLPHVAIWAVALWILTGALFKLLAGTPKDLPEIVRTVTPLALPLTYKLVIAIELALVVFSFLRPRLAWPFLVLQLLVFDAVLTAQIAAGDANCGCFGSKVTMSPWVMLGIDTVLLLFLLYSRPWKGVARVAPVPVGALLALAAASAPWLYDRQVSAPVAGKPIASANGSTGEPDEAEPASAEAGGPKWAILSPEEWVGKSLFDTELVDWLGEERLSTLPPDGTWIFYRQSCSHCAEHLEELALADTGLTYYVLIQVPDDLQQAREVHILPSGDHVVAAPLPEGVDYVMTTPADMTIAGYDVVAARESIGHEDEDHDAAPSQPK